MVKTIQDIFKDSPFKRQLSKLSDQYMKFKKSYTRFPTKIKGTFHFIIKNFPISSFLDLEFKSQLHYVKITFDTPKFEQITKDRAAKFVDQISAIGGTMGLLTGFSIISAVEILYFLITISAN